MDPYITDWLNLIIRFIHVVTGIAWIGASFYFIWLDNHLENPPEWKKEKGIKGDLWAIHGGGFYEVAKYELAPPVLPDILHWFKWEAYSTWISGFFLLALMYYVGAETYLIDPRVANISQAQAIGIGLGAIFGSWIIYDLLCRSPLAKSSLFLGLVLLISVGLLAFGLSQVFSPRGAYMHVGAVIGTIMAGNVFRVIIPSQKALVAAVEAGGRPDPAWAAKAKLVSTHNTYLTLPVIFIMISSHYPMTYNHEFAWAILIAIILITALARQYFVLRHKNNHQPFLMAGVIVATLILAYVIAPSRDKAEATSPVSFDPSLSVETIIKQRCATCHSATPTDEVFRIAPSGVILDTPDDIERWAAQIIARTVVNKDMPMINKTDMTDEERLYLNEKLGK
ncbi:MAG: urate hydroxylase PuuD [Pseudomonadales bacterium]|nr:urate hydroxylase PuuD [Pseudomonadales bacterium]